MSIIPLPYRLAIFAVLCGAVFGLATLFVHKHDAGIRAAEDAKLNSAYAVRIKTAEDAKEAAEAHTASLEHQAAVDLSKAETNHQSEVQIEQSKTNAITVAYRNGQRKLQFYQSADTGGCGNVSSSSSAPSGSNDQAIVDLPAEISGRVLAVGQEVDSELVPQIKLLQDTVRAYQAAAK